MLLSEKDKQTLCDFIEKHFKFNGHNDIGFLVEVTSGSIADDVKISVIEDKNLYIRTTNQTSVIDWKNYDF